MSDSIRETEGPWELLRHYNIAAVITDSPAKENLEFLSETTLTTADHSFVRFHGRNMKGHYWYNYLYSKEELEPWVEKIDKIKEQTKAPPKNRTWRTPNTVLIKRTFATDLHSYISTT
jgi:uncharacterized protein YecE (DUF72 family)